ncbi:hypothetical protein [Paraflavitalea sp. CAU 1676]|uniref:hypothetical protein n=1 Tax=Paraflavitalea sp. CAU 1676 TaxID=3032598 RepID=UPI0023D99CEC|nr:hypothetical protein [Paraflavitalea sp. CAU 1676]MDF2191303.1 hypothetical protein [Paraflavitalea sp. CAU 1676]
MDDAGAIFARPETTSNDEFSTGIQFNPDHWDQKFQQVSKVEPRFQTINKGLKQFNTPPGGHFGKLAGTHELVTPQLVIEAYRRPAPAPQGKSSTSFHRMSFAGGKWIVPIN